MATFFLVLALLAQDSSVGVVGRWDAQTRSNGGIGTWIEFANDGSCIETTGAMVDGVWKAEGEEFSVTMTDDRGTSAVQRGRWSVDGATMKQTSEGQSRLLTRVSGGAPGSSPLVGVWSYPHQAGGTAYEQYLSDGRFLFRLPIRSGTCRWSVEGSRIRISADRGTRDATWRIDRDRLTLESVGRTDTFRRETAGILKSR